MTNPILTVAGLHKSFGPIEVLRGINLSVARGETVVILGGSGSGKSTLLRCINLLEKPTSGMIEMEGEQIGRPGSIVGQMAYKEKDLARFRARIGMVFQQFNLFPHLSVRENVSIGQRRVLGRDRRKADERAMSELEHVGLATKAESYPHQLSGGQQQRVAIARALAMDPAVMLFDEATSALDPELVGEVLATMRALRESGMTMLIVTHELGFAYHIADRVVFLDKGLVCEEGTPHEVILKPRHPRTQDFMHGHTMFRLPDVTDGRTC